MWQFLKNNLKTTTQIQLQGFLQKLEKQRTEQKAKQPPITAEKADAMLAALFPRIHQTHQQLTTEIA